MGTSLSRRHCGLGSKVPQFDNLYPPSGEINFWGRLYSLECAGAAFYLLGFLFCRLLTGILLGAFLWTRTQKIRYAKLGHGALGVTKIF